MNHIFNRNLLACAALALLSGCTPEGFEVTPCLLNSQLAFRIHPIDGWFTDYQPRPMSVLVVEEFTGNDEEFMNSKAPYRWPGLWSAELRYYGDEGAYTKRPSRQRLLYGQRLPQWNVEQSAKRLIDGKNYHIMIRDSGRSGYASFTAGGPLPACP